MDAGDLLVLEEYTYQLLESLVNSTPNGMPFADYTGPIRISMSYGAERVPSLVFVIDFPPKFEFGGGEPDEPNGVTVALHPIKGISATALSGIITTKMACTFVTNPFSNIRLGYSGSSTSVNGKTTQAHYWLRMPEKCTPIV
jgi:hypothetical protein